MNKKYFFISILIFLMVSCTPAYAQWMVTDPSSITQRLTLFMEEIAEAMSSRYSLEKQTDNTSELLENSKKSLEKLQKISNYIKSALVIQEIAEESTEVMKKISNINSKFSKLDNLTEEEVYNVLNFALDLGEQISDKVKESNKVTKGNKTTSGEMTDYERLQVLNEIKDEIVKLKKNLDALEKRFKSKNSYETFSKQARVYTREALFMAFEVNNETEGIIKEANKSKKSKSTK